MPHSFCSDLSREQGDPLGGSAAHAERNLLISWPRAKWTRHLRRASDMPDSLRQTLDAIADDGRRINLIHRREQPADLHRVYLMPERRSFRVPREALEAFLGAWQSGEPMTTWEEAPVEHDLVLCCTHGKKDKCCAKFGYQTYKRLAEEVAAHDLPFEVWESSHLGGCRFAASLILLSPVRKYGRITPQQALPFLQAEARGQRFLPGYRGDSRLTPAQQCAQLAALTHLSESPHAPRLTLMEDAGDERCRHQRWRWEREDERGDLRIVCDATTIRRIDTCADLEAGPSDSTVWRVSELVARGI